MTKYRIVKYATLKGVWYQLEKREAFIFWRYICGSYIYTDLGRIMAELRYPRKEKKKWWMEEIVRL